MISPRVYGTKTDYIKNSRYINSAPAFVKTAPVPVLVNARKARMITSMRPFRRRRIAGNEPGIGGHMLTLSVFIMLLAFFIVLNAISSVKQHKAGPALRSIGETFSRAPSEVVPPSTPDEGGDAAQETRGSGDSLEAMDALFRAQMPGLRAERDATRGVMHVHLTQEALQSALDQVGTVKLPEESVYRWKPGSFVATLVALAAGGSGGQALRMDVLFNLDQDPLAFQESRPAALTAVLRAAGNAARILEKAGLPPASLSVGLKTGQPRTVDIYFRESRPYAPVTAPPGSERPAGAEP